MQFEELDKSRLNKIDVQGNADKESNLWAANSVEAFNKVELCIDLYVHNYRPKTVRVRYSLEVSAIGLPEPKFGPLPLCANR